MASRYIIFGKSTCHFCMHAVDYCKASSREYLYIDLEGQPDVLEEYKKFYNHETVPIILKNDLDSGLVSFIGGFSELTTLAEKEISSG